ncbi:hypothetical protein [Streptomyces mirabilis]|uniref:hypothetical protein n=1 Tax=Streptomyces mirabilis TaxID=68239 RepID=UPI0036F20BCC
MVADHAVREAREQRTLRIVAISFFALAAYVTLRAARTLTGTGEVERSIPGIVLAALSLAVMPFQTSPRSNAPSLDSAMAPHLLCRISSRAPALSCTDSSARLAPHLSPQRIRCASPAGRATNGPPGTHSLRVLVRPGLRVLAARRLHLHPLNAEKFTQILLTLGVSRAG